MAISELYLPWLIPSFPAKVSHYMSHFPLLNVRILSRIFMHSHVLRFEIKSSMIYATFGLEKKRHLLELNHLGALYCLCNWHMRWSTLYNWLCFRSLKDPKICVIDKTFSHSNSSSDKATHLRFRFSIWSGRILPFFNIQKKIHTSELNSAQRSVSVLIYIQSLYNRTCCCSWHVSIRYFRLHICGILYQNDPLWIGYKT